MFHKYILFLLYLYSLQGLIESNTTLREGRGNPIPSVEDLQSTTKACRVVDVANLGPEDGIPESLLQCGV